MAKTIKKHWDIAVVVGIGLFLTIAGIVGMFGMISLPSSVSAATSATATVSVQATVAETIAINVSSSDMNLGTLETGSVSATSNNFTVETNCSGYTVTIKDVGDGGGNGGLYGTSSSYLIASATEDLGSGGVEGYGAQGTSTVMGIYSPYTASGSNVGALDGTTAQDFASSSSPTLGDQATLTLKAGITATTTADTYYDTLTLTATGPF